MTQSLFWLEPYQMNQGRSNKKVGGYLKMQMIRLMNAHGGCVSSVFKAFAGGADF